MPAAKRSQSNTMLYTLVIFVGLFIITTALAVIFYVKYEEQLEAAQTAQEDLQEYVTPQQQRNIENLVGTKQRNESYLGKAIDYIDRLSTMITTEIPSDVSAETKVSTVSENASDLLISLNEKPAAVGVAEPNQTTLLRALEKTKLALENMTEKYNSLSENMSDLETKFDDAMQESFEKEQKLLAEKEQLQQQVNNIESSYEELKAMVRQSSEQKVQSLMDNLEEKEQEIKSLNQELQKTRAELIMARNKMESALKELRAAKPLPDEEITAYQPDGEIILVDESLDLVHINLGQKDQVYPGLTFTVYDSGAPISKDGKGKAEIEVFKTKDNISQARIVSSRKPILEGDQIANLVWDSNETNYFVVAGEFDLNKDGTIESNAKEKIEKLITDWGGKITDEVTIETDYVILGKAPVVPQKPGFEELEIHPRAMEKYNQAVEKLDEYKKVREQASTLSIPVFNYERFLYFTGYYNQADKEGAF